MRKSVQGFNQFIGSLEQFVMPHARRFKELEVEGTSTEIAPLEPIDFAERLTAANGDGRSVRLAHPV